MENTRGFCPITLCAKSLLNGPCGGAKDGKCEVDPERDCGWHRIFERLKELGREELMLRYQAPKNWRRSGSPRSLRMEGTRADFSFADASVTAGSDEGDSDEKGQQWARRDK